MSSRSSTSPGSNPFPPGTVLAGKYRVERLLGEGGMGWVVVATHLQLEQRVAIKFMHASYTRETTEAVPRFLREARAAARIQSEHVARVSDFGTLENGAPYLVMEYLEGEDLESLLRSRGALPTEVVVDYAMQACEGLAEAHAAGIVHRDLKPANLFLARRTDGSVRVKLLDFGISKLSPSGGVPEVAMTNTQALMGSPLYMAPEQMRSSKNVDGRADIWSMGVILYEMMAGRPPFDGETLPAVCARIMTEPPRPLRTLDTGVSAGLEAAVLRCLEKEPRERFPDVAALARAIAPFGAPEAEIAANRIGRVTRARAASVADIASDAVLPTPGGRGAQADVRGGAPLPERSAGAQKGVAQTSAEFSHTGSTSPTRRGARVAAIGGAALIVVGAMVAGVVATRGHSQVETRGSAAPGTTIPTATATPLAAAIPTPSASPTGTAPPTATATRTATAPPTAAATRTAAVRPSDAQSSTPASAKPPAMVSPSASARQLPRAKPAPTTKPAATAAFGGRD